MELTESYLGLKGYLGEDGKFFRFPGKREKQKQTLMLRFLADQFEVGKQYTEKEVNDVLNQYHSFNDPPTLRRLMFGHQFLARTLDGRSYWIPEDSEG